MVALLLGVFYNLYSLILVFFINIPSKEIQNWPISRKCISLKFPFNIRKKKYIYIFPNLYSHTGAFVNCHWTLIVLVLFINIPKKKNQDWQNWPISRKLKMYQSTISVIIIKKGKNIYFSQLMYSHTYFRKLSLDVDHPRFIFKHTVVI